MGLKDKYNYLKGLNNSVVDKRIKELAAKKYKPNQLYLEMSKLFDEFCTPLEKLL